MIEEKKEVFNNFVPSEKEVTVINRVFERFNKMKEERDQERHEFDGMTLTNYVNASMDAYNGIVSDDLKLTKENWQSIIWDHKTRGKVKTTISMIIGMRPFIYIAGKKELYNKYAADVFEIYEDSWKNENGSYKLYLQALSACNKGTVIVEEIYREEKIRKKEIVSVNQQTGKVRYREKEIIKGGAGRVEANIVPLLNFYPNENSAEIEHDCCVVGLYEEKVFQNKFGKYPNAAYIKPGIFSSTNYDGIKYKSISKDSNTLIEMIRYYNEDTDEFVMLANGFWLNPQEDDEVSPIPFNHKKLPFTKTVFELADEDNFYGKSLPDLMRGEQDADNALIRLMIDQEILAINKPILLGMGIEMESYELYPGAIKKMTGDISQMKEMDISGATQSGFQLLQLLKNNSDVNTSIDPTAQGVHSGRKTARETVILDENSKRNSGPFQMHIYKLLLDRAKLRIENIKQFYTNPVQYSVLKDAMGNPVMDSSGKKKITKPEYREIPISKPGKNPKWMKIDPAIKGADFELRFIEDYEVTDNRSYRIEMAKALLDEAKANPLINADEATIEYLETIRKNPERFYIKPDPQAIKFQNEQGLPPKNNTVPVV